MRSSSSAVLCGLASAFLTAASVFGQYPYGASDQTYGLRSRIADNPSYKYTASPADWRDVNMYQLFTDRFADGDSANNTSSALNINRSSWYVGSRSFPQNRNFHHGGDWKGMKDNLDYLSNMGVKAIWMSGVQMNNQGKDANYTPYHMYHPTDFFRVDPVMGTFQDLKDLIDACHARGIYVILDVVVNHTADLNGLWGNNQQDDKQYWSNGNGTFGWWDSRRHAEPFNDLQWFHNNGTINNWDSYPENVLGQFKGTDDLKTENTTVQGWMDQAFKNLIDATDCDGFRVDAIKHIEFNWIMAWADSMRQHAAFRGKNDFIIFGEYFSYDNGALARYCKDPGSFNSALFFPMSQTIKSVFVDNGWAGQLTQQLNQKSQYGEGADRLVAFIDNHDVNRISLLNGGDSANDVWKLRPALSFLYLATPVPCLFYGTEHVFDQGGHYNGSNRTTDNPDDGDWQRECMFDRGFQPGPAQGNKLAATSAPLYQHIKALNAARDAHKSLTRGSFTERWTDGAYAFSRVYDNEESLVAINLGDGSKAINVTVSKPDGTEFVNALNDADKATVSGGKLTFTMSGKETKVYVAGISTPQMWVRGTHSFPADGVATATDAIYINTEAGPTGVVASAKVGYSADGGTTWNLLTMSPTNWASVGGTWFNARLGAFPANTVIKYYIEIADANGNKKWDNNSGQNYTLTVKQPAGPWVRNVQNYPVDGEVTDLTDLYVNAEAGPSNTLTGVSLSFSTNGTAWVKTNMTVNAGWGSEGGKWFNVNLGKFAAGLKVRYFIEATDGTLTNKNDNGGVNYIVTVRSIAEDLWVGNSRHSPVNGSITPSSPITITCETWPIGIATNAAMVYSIDGGANWSVQLLSFTLSTNNNDVWNTTLGPYPDGTVLQYAIAAQSTALELWDNNGGVNYQAIVGELGIRMAPYSPVITTAGGPDNPTDAFDLDTSGRSLATSGTNGFGSFGNVYVNYDETYLYIGATNVNLPTDSSNNAYIVFVSGGANAGSANLWNFNGPPEGLDKLHNTAYQPGINFAILLGDVYGDGTYTNFAMYSSGGFPFGQGIFATPAAGTAFAPVAGSKISQFGGYGLGNRLAHNWESAIPLSAFGVSNAASLTNLYLSGLMVTAGTSNNNRFISGRYLGDSATLGNGEQPDAFGNFAYSFVNLGGSRVIPPTAGDDLGVPESWVTNNFPTGHQFNANSDYDSDGQTDRNEYFAGLNPTTNDNLHVMSMGNGMAYVNKHGGQSITYVIDVADRVDGGAWNWTPQATRTSLDGSIVMPELTLTCAVMRLRVQVPPVNNNGDRVTVSATPAGGTFSATNISITLSVSGVNVTSSTYTVQGGSATAYTNGQVIGFGSGMTNGQTRTLTLNGSTLNGVSNEKIYTYTKSEAPVQISWTGNVTTDPAAGSWDTNETLTLRIQTAPIGAAASVGAVFNVNGGATWSVTNLAKTGSNSSNDLWAVTLPAYPAGTVIQFALEAKDSQNNSTWNNNNSANYTVSVNGGGGGGTGNGKFTPYSSNPTMGQYRSSGITVDGSNTGGEWTTNMMIAIDMANDDPRSLGSNWTMHEGPADVTHLWACWDDTKLYLAWQFVDLTDKLDPSNAGSALGGRISNSQGILQFISFDTLAGQGAVSNMWAKNDRMTGANVPDYQIGLRSDLFASFISKSVGGIFAGDSSRGTNYFSTAEQSIAIARAPGYVAPVLWGVWDLDTYLSNTNSALTEFLGAGHDASRDSFYEMSIPFTALGITKAQLESSGIGVFINVGSTSSIDSIPNDGATLNTPGVTGSNSTFEWEDTDLFTVPYARVAK